MLLRLLAILRAYTRETAPPLPFSLTLGVTYRCNLFCATCNVTPQRVPEMSLRAWQKVFASMGGSIPWLTVTGGEPLLRKDLLPLISSAVHFLSPRLVTLPTNGTLPEKLSALVAELTASFPKTTFLVNLSLDGPKEVHNAIRKTHQGAALLQQSYQKLRQLRRKNLLLGIASVLSKANLSAGEELLETVHKLAPDSFVFEPAQERKELYNQTMGLTPEPQEYLRTAEKLYAGYSPPHRHLFSQVIRRFKRYYHPLTAATLSQKRQLIPCFAGVGSCHIQSSGWLWECCTDTSRMGFLPAVHYDFPTLWQSFRARRVREKVREKRCACPMGNVSYLNMLFAPWKTRKIARATKAYESLENIAYDV